MKNSTKFWRNSRHINSLAGGRWFRYRVHPVGDATAIPTPIKDWFDEVRTHNSRYEINCTCDRRNTSLLASEVRMASSFSRDSRNRVLTASSSWSL